jgi:predicted RNA-binding Zn ribbon-like protein
MSKPYDTTLKQLLSEFAPDWLGWLGPRLGLPPTAAVDPLDVDLSTVQAAADKAFRLRPPASGLLHIEPQASWDGDYPDRLFLYSALLEDRYGGPVYTVALLLRRDANLPALTGTLSRRYPDGREYLRFEYSVVRLWEQPADQLLAGGIGTLPLALLTDDAAPRLPEVVTRIADRFTAAAVPQPTRDLLWSCGYILMGLRYDDSVAGPLLQGVRNMRESMTYQAILREGGVAVRQEDLLDILRERFTTVPPEIETRIRSTTDLARLQAAIRQALRVSSPDELTL